MCNNLQIEKIVEVQLWYVEVFPIMHDAWILKLDLNNNTSKESFNFVCVPCDDDIFLVICYIEEM